MASDTVQKVKEKLSIVDVVSPYVKLTRAGKYWKGLSPFNKEKTPSFYVNVERQSYYCFSSNQGGDMFTFIEKMEGVDFKGALKILAEKAGVPLEYVRQNPGEKEKKDRLYEAMARAEQYYERALTETSPARAYALSRGLTEKTIGEWRLGFAPDSWRALLEDLAGAGFSAKELADAGLVKEAEGKPGTWYDRFRNRLMFPIRDAAGRTVAFTGRALDPKDEAKYLNSPETELFKKSHILFAMDRAKDAIRTRGFALLMEGQMDVLHAHQAGFTNAVGISGTALTPEHLSLMKRYSENLMLCLDADRAGLAATQKHALAALRSGMRVKAVLLPEGKDPADLISEDPREFTKRVAEAATVVEFFLAVLSEKEKDQHKLVLATERIVLPLVSAIQSPVEREHFVGVVARAIASTPEAVRATLPKASVASAPASAPVPRPAPAEVVDPIVRLRAIVEAYPDSLIAKRVESEYTRIVGSAMAPEASPEKVLFETGILYGEAPDEHAADDALRLFEKSHLVGAYNRALQELRSAETSRDAARIRAAEAECARLMKTLALL
jgi:DNA primase